jgi:hypothetical protein
MQLLNIRFSVIDESNFFVNARSGAGQAESKSSLPFYETKTKWRTTLIKILEIGKFSLDKFSDEEKLWMAQEGLLLSNGTGFSADYLEKIGRSLYKALFPVGEVSDLLQRSIALAEQDRNPQLHIQIEFNAKVTEQNRLPDYPWEMVHDGQRFLAHHNVTFSRYIAHLSAPPKLSAVSPINVLLVSSGASDEENGLAPLSKREQEAVKKGLEKSQENGHIRLSEPKQASLKALEVYLDEHSKDKAPHILHFDGHGVFGKRCQNSECRTFHGNLKLEKCKKCGTALSASQGYLLFEPDEDDDDDLEANYVSAEEIGSLLGSIRHGDSESQQGGVRLAVLSACKSAYALGGNSVFNGVAQSLIGHGVPAVVAMQYTVSTKGATAFAERFYRELGNKQSLAVATSQGRVAMQNVEHNQWYRLIFYLRWQANDGGQLFAVEDVSTRKNKIANLFKVPDLPKRSLPRDEDVAALKELVLGESANKVVMTGVARKVGLQGMGGVGKSVLAAMIARDEAVRRKFPDGIIWISLGQEANLLLRQGDVAIALSRPNPSLADVEQGKTYLSELFAEKACLLVLDDVWELEQIEAFNVLADQSQLLITSRDTRLTEDLDGAMGYRVGLLDDQKALELLALLAEKSPEELTEDAKAVVKECGNLPLALAMVGAMARGKSNPWASLLNRLRNADIEKIKQQFPNYPYTDLFRAIEVSIQALDAAIRERYLDFAVFPEDVPVPLAVLQTFWQAEGLDELEVEETIETLVGKSLLQQDSSQYMSLHDLQRDYLRKQVDEVALHNKLLAAYAAQCPQGWASGSDDGYYLDRLIYHLEKAGRVEEIHDLLWQTGETGGNAWFETRDPRGQTAGYIADLRRAWELAEQNWTEAPLPQVMERQCRYALIFSSLNFLSDIPTGLLEGLVKVGLPYGWSPEKGLAYARQIPYPDKRAKNLEVLIKYLPSEQQAEIGREVLSAAQAIQSESNRADVLSALAANLPEELYKETLSAAQAIQEEYYRAKVLSALAVNPPEELYKEALSAAQAIQSESNRTKFLSALAANPSEELYKEALNAAQAIQDERDRAKVLSALAANLPEELYKEALIAAQAIQDEDYRADVLIALAANLPEKLYKEALSAAQDIQSAYNRTQALIALAAKFPEELYKEALSAAQAFQDERYRASLLIPLAAKFPEAYKEALSAAQAIQDESSRTQALSALAANLPEELYKEALIAAQAIQDEFYRTQALTALAAKFPEAYKEALSAAQAIQDEYARTDVLIALAAKFPEVYKEALSATLVFQDESYRAYVLSALAANLPEELYEEALSAALAFQGEYFRAKVLSALAADLPEELYEEALSAALAIQSESYRADVLIALAAKFPKAYKEALSAALAFQDESYRAYVLSKLAAKFPEAYKEALSAAQAIQKELDRTRALIALAADLPEELYKEALSAALTLQDVSAALAVHCTSYRADVLIALAVNLPEELYKEALSAALAFQSESYRAKVLIALAANLPEELYKEALSAALAFQSESYRADVLIALAANLPEELYKEALSAALAIQSESYRADVLSALAANLPEELYKETLSAALAFQVECNRAKVLIALAAKFPEAYKEALSAALAFQFESDRADVLIALAANLPQYLYKEALSVAQSIQYESDRADVLIALAAKFPEAYKEALSVALAFQSESDRVKFLSTLVANLPQYLYQEALIATLAFQDESDRANALNNLIPQSTTFPTSQQFTIWQEILSQGLQRKRPKFLSNLAASVPLIESLGGKVAGVAVARSIQQVAKWWR